MDALIVIPARGGSKGIPQKNIKLLGGKPLIYYTIEAAREVFSDEQICVSTDSQEIKEIVEKTGLKVPFLRPAELASDNAGTYEVLLHAIKHYEIRGRYFDNLVLLQPTSPFRKREHILEALQLYKSDIDMVVSVCKSEGNPYFNLFELNENGFLEKSKEGKYSRRQDCPKVWKLNGSIYIMNVKSLQVKHLSEFTKITMYEMPVNYSLDIDEPVDWDFAEFMLAKKIHDKESS